MYSAIDSEHRAIDVNFLKQITPENNKKVKLTLANGFGPTYEYVCDFTGLIYDNEPSYNKTTATFWFKVIKIRKKRKGAQWTTTDWPRTVFFPYFRPIRNPPYVHGGMESYKDYLKRLRLPEEWWIERAGRPGFFTLKKITIYGEEDEGEEEEEEEEEEDEEEAEGEEDDEEEDADDDDDDSKDATDAKDASEVVKKRKRSKTIGGRQRKSKSKSKSKSKGIRKAKTKSRRRIKI